MSAIINLPKSSSVSYAAALLKPATEKVEPRKVSSNTNTSNTSNTRHRHYPTPPCVSVSFSLKTGAIDPEPLEEAVDAWPSLAEVSRTTKGTMHTSDWVNIKPAAPTKARR